MSARPRHRRRVIRALVMLLLGAAFTVAIAWMSSGPSSGAEPDERHLATLDNGVTAFVRRSTGATSDSIVITPDDGERRDPHGLEHITRILPAWASGTALDVPSRMVHFERAFGWPWLALATATTTDSATPGGKIIIHHGALLDLTAVPALNLTRGWMIIPTRPIWPGIVGDTLLYASLASIIAYGPGWLRRRRRALRGLCTECAYGPFESGTCPECGAVRR